MPQVAHTPVFSCLNRLPRQPGWHLDFTINLTVNGVLYHLQLRNGVLIHRTTPATASPAATASVTLSKPRLMALLAGDATSPGIDITGDPHALHTLLSVTFPGDPDFAIVTP